MATEPNTAKIKTFLKAKGHKAEKVDDTKLKWNTKAARIAAILELHGVAEAEYQAGIRPSQ